jgi:Tol biopolymer transport system component
MIRNVRGWRLLGATAAIVWMTLIAIGVASSTPPGRNGLIAFATDGDGPTFKRPGIAVIRPDGRGARLLTRGRNDREPAWSRAGKRLAFARNSHVYVVNEDGSGVRQVTRGNGVDSDPSWSPDGRQIAFIRSQKIRPGLETPRYWLMVVNADGRHPHVLLTRPTNEAFLLSGTSWSPDGRTIAVGAGFGQDAEIAVVPVAGGREWYPLDNADELADDRDPDWNPDGTRIAVSRTLWLCERCDVEGITVVDSTNSTSTVLAERLIDPSWSPDGKYLVAVAARALVILDMQGNSRTLISGGVSGPAWQPLR